MKLLRVGAIVCIAWYAAAALTPLTSVAIRNSTIDSTGIGGTTPSVVRATYAQVNSVTPSPLPSQGLYQGWNRNSAGDADFFNHPGGGGGGFNWYQTNSGGSIGSPIMNLSGSGILSTTSGTFNQTAGLSPYSAGSNVNGGWIGWGQTSVGGTNLGEMDFFAEHATGSGGFNWYDTTSPSTAGSPIARLDAAGNLNLRSVTVSTALAGPLIGNASTATALAAAPSNCATTTPATGVQANGTANCGSYPSSANNPGYATLPGGIIVEWGTSGSYDTGPISLTFAKPFPHACLNAIVGSVYTGASRISSAVSCNTTSVTVSSDGLGESNYTAYGW